MAQASANWSAANQWQDTGDNGYYTPAAGDECRLNGYTVVMDVAAIPASGALTALNAMNTSGVDTAGRLTVDLSSVGSCQINALAAAGGLDCDTCRRHRLRGQFSYTNHYRQRERRLRFQLRRR